MLNSESLDLAILSSVLNFYTYNAILNCWTLLKPILKLAFCILELDF